MPSTPDAGPSAGDGVSSASIYSGLGGEEVEVGSGLMDACSAVVPGLAACMGSGDSTSAIDGHQTCSRGQRAGSSPKSSPRGATRPFK